LFIDRNILLCLESQTFFSQITKQLFLLIRVFGMGVDTMGQTPKATGFFGRIKLIEIKAETLRLIDYIKNLT
jgi:hypothetical protein